MYHPTIPYISPRIYPTLPCIPPYHTIYIILHLPYRTPTLYTTLPCHHTLYIILHLPCRTPYPLYHPTIPSDPIYHPASTLPYLVYHPTIPYISSYICPIEHLPCIPPYHTIIPYISSYISPIEHPTLYTTIPYHRILYITPHLPYPTLPCIPPYHIHHLILPYITLYRNIALYI